MIATVTFDFWETLVRDSAENLWIQRELRIRALSRTLARAGALVPENLAAAAYDRSAEVLGERFWSRHRDLSCREQARVVLDCASPGLAARIAPALLEEFVAAYIAPVLDYPPQIQPGAVQALGALAARGVSLGIISNTGRTPGVILRRLLERHGLLGHFTVISYSDEVGYRKPDAEIFLRTLAQAGARPEEAAHVGDNPLDDVTGAQAIGMRAIHYTAGRQSPALHADLCVADLAALPDALDRL
ncbi:MAG TPA: HAD family hydrolase [Methylomirabilota bacterium]|nr:HAD family hydrolase [Methylomirabilota bacterium]